MPRSEYAAALAQLNVALGALWRQFWAKRITERDLIAAHAQLTAEWHALTLRYDG